MDDRVSCYAETSSSVDISPLRSIRIKVTDRCSWNCYWCHNEGSGKRDPKKVGDMIWNEELSNALSRFREELSIKELHLTGGEPTAHPEIANLIREMHNRGYIIKATSTGCSEQKLREIVSSGLRGINISFHALDPEILRSTQLNRGSKWANKQLRQQINTVLLALDLGIEVKLNVVITGIQDLSRALSIYGWARQYKLPLRMMNEIESGHRAINAVFEFVRLVEAVEIGRKYIRGSSSYSIFFRTNDDYTFAVKLIDDTYLERTMCGGCYVRQKSMCGEKFYGVRLESRLYDGSYRVFVRLCIHRTDPDTYIPVDKFFDTPQFYELKEIIGNYS